MRQAIFFICLALLIPAVAGAQAEPPFYGTWNVMWEGKKQVYTAKLVLAAEGGTWKTALREKNNPCVGREVPVKVNSISADEAQLTLAFSDVIPGCKDSQVVLRSTANGVVGKRGDAELVLKRE